jgi:hypothetical protein
MTIKKLGIVFFLCSISSIYASENVLDEESIYGRQTYSRTVLRVFEEGKRQGSTKGHKEGVEKALETLSPIYINQLKVSHPTLFQPVNVEYKEPDYEKLLSSTSIYADIALETKPKVMKFLSPIKGYIPALGLGARWIPGVERINISALRTVVRELSDMALLTK